MRDVCHLHSLPSQLLLPPKPHTLYCVGFTRYTRNTLKVHGNNLEDVILSRSRERERKRFCCMYSYGTGVSLTGGTHRETIKSQCSTVWDPRGSQVEVGVAGTVGVRSLD